MTQQCDSIPIPLGQTVMTANALEQLHLDDVQFSLARHAIGDWGDLAAEDQKENELALREGFRVFSAYRDRNGTRFWIITEADRSITTVLLPEDY